MKSGPIFVILAVGAMLGWFSPDVADRAGPAPDADQALNEQEQQHLEMARQQQWYAGNVVLPRNSDGHFYADVTIDGATREMLVDTGASMIALTGADAEAMGVQWNQADVEQVARGANGPVYGVRVTLDKVQLGTLEASGVEAVVVPEGLGISLLGQSFLSTIGKVEMDREQMILGG